MTLFKLTSNHITPRLVSCHVFDLLMNKVNDEVTDSNSWQNC